MSAREHRSGEDTLIPIDKLELRNLLPGTQLAINPTDPDAFGVLVVDPEEGQAVIRLRGRRDVRATLGSQPFDEEDRALDTGREVDPDDVEWGSLVFGSELILRNEESDDGIILATGRLIDYVQLLN